MDTEPTAEQQLIRHAERQTNALESINRVVVAWFVLGLIAAVIWIFAAAG